jgi:gliding motility-associated-like protein
LKHYIHILISVILFSLVASPTMAQNPFDLPMACSGATEQYWVKGLNGISTFEWRVIFNHPNGIDRTDITEQVLTYDSESGDRVLINWPSDPQLGGIYTFEVVEQSAGCIGSVYTEDIVLNSSVITIPFDNVPTQVAVCFGEEAALDPGLFRNYLWQDGYNGRIYYTSEAGTYQVRLVNQGFSCTYNDMTAIIKELPHVWLGNDTVLYGVQTLLLDVYDPDIRFYDWSTGAISPSILVEGGSGNQEISVTVTNWEGCSNSDTILIAAADYDNLQIPSAFTPNGDGKNDTWIFPGRAEGSPELYPYLDNVDVMVFNRWGKLVWQSSGMFKAWDGRDIGGRPLPMDSYHYIIKINVDNKTFEYKGAVTIVR